MRSCFVALLALAVLVASGSLATAATVTRVERINDGDTITTTNGWRIRLLQVDTPELHDDECYSREAKVVLTRLAPVGSLVRLDADPGLDEEDRYGRKLRYVRRGRMLVNLELVRRGAAAPYFYRGEQGIHARRLASQARGARAARRGAWGACPRATLNMTRAWSTGTAAGGTGGSGGSGGGGTCNGHPFPCAPPYPPDRDCSEIGRPVWTGSSDPHRIDGDGDGIGCESY